ncbi:MAG: DUF61 family protein [Methanomassiliicoccales archaeon]|jgi:uncharacterized protein (UPF0216 family)|nr:DUF61 family protein [Methanomassiliicoccales archaeon]
MFSDGAFEKFIASMNRHIPSTRRRLIDLLREESPCYTGKDGNRYAISKNEIEYIASLLDDVEKERLRLPIFIVTDTSYPGGAWKVSGKIEVKLISRIIGREPENEDEIWIFYPHLMELRKRLPTSTTCLYVP